MSYRTIYYEGRAIITSDAEDKPGWVKAAIMRLTGLHWSNLKSLGCSVNYAPVQPVIDADYTAKALSNIIKKYNEKAKHFHYQEFGRWCARPNKRQA